MQLESLGLDPQSSCEGEVELRTRIQLVVSGLYSSSRLLPRFARTGSASPALQSLAMRGRRLRVPPPPRSNKIMIPPQ